MFIRSLVAPRTKASQTRPISANLSGNGSKPPYSSMIAWMVLFDDARNFPSETITRLATRDPKAHALAWKAFNSEPPATGIDE